MSSAPRLELFERRANGPRAERFRATIDGAAVEARVVKTPFARDAQRFLSRTEALSQVSHPSLRMVLHGALLPDGRPAAVMSSVDWVPLSASPKVATGALLSMAIELTEGLVALHEAGLVMGILDGDDIYPGSPAVLDASLAGLAQDGDTPVEDVKMLALALQGAIGGGKEAAPLEGILDKARQGLSASELLKELTGLRTRWQARTTSGNFQLHVPQPEELAEPDLSGQTLSHWTIEGLLGEGAMARVYRATDTRTQEAVAVKVLKQEHVTEPEYVQRFLQEVKAVEAINNPHIVKVTHFDDVQGQGNQRLVYCVMELLEGQALADAMSTTFEVARAVRLCLHTAQCLSAAHQQGIIHRDIKPENLFLTQREGQEFVKVLDFGIAKLLRPIGDLKRVGTKAGVVVGTPEYMSPEQAMGGEADPRMDVYAVGLVLYELLANRQPFIGDTFGKLVVEITQKAPPPLPDLTALREPIPEGLAAVVMKCLEKKPEHRFQSAAELATALEPFAVARPRRSSSSSIASQDLEPVSMPSEAELQAVVTKSRAPMIIAVVVLLIIAGAVGWVVFGPSGEANVEKPTPKETPVEVTPPPKDEAPPVEPKPVEPAAPVKVKVTIGSKPVGALVKRGDEELGVTPLSLELLREEKPVTLVLSLKGYQVATRDVALTEDTRFDVALEKEKPSKKASAKKPAKALKKKK